MVSQENRTFSFITAKALKHARLMLAAVIVKYVIRQLQIEAGYCNS